MKTKAAILVEQNRPLELAEVDIPALSYGQVLVEIESSRICGSQLGEIAGVKGPDKWLPHLLGHEGSGYVREVGPEVSTVKPGDKVCLHWRPGSGIQSKPPLYHWDGKQVNAGFVTTFNHYAVVSENRITVVPDHTDNETVCLLADTLTTGFGVINNDASVNIGESIVVIGAGGIGLGVIQGAKLAGANPIIAVDLYPYKLEIAKIFGATHCIDSTQGSWAARVMEILEGNPDVIVDGTGNEEVIAEAYKLLSQKGRLVLVGVMHYSNELSLNTLPLHFGKSIKGSEGGSSHPDVDIPKFLRMIQQGIFDPAQMVSHRGRLEDVNQLIEKMQSGEVVHAIMNY